MFYITDTDLNTVLTAGDDHDISILADHITDSGNNRISLSGEAFKQLMDAKRSGHFDAASRALVAEELSRFGGNSLMNLFRGGAGVSYDEIARDVADHLDIATHARAVCGDVEKAVIVKVMEQSLAKMSEDQKAEFFAAFNMRYGGTGRKVASVLLATIAQSSTNSLSLAAIVANGIATALLGRGVGAGAGILAGTGGTRVAAAFLGPIGWALTVIWTAYGLTSPAYRVTVPCVIQIAYMRLKMAAAGCPNCRAAIGPEARFCSACGTPLTAMPRLAGPD